MSPWRAPSNELLAEAVRLARENAEAGQGPFGALVARDGEVVGTGVNTTIRDSDPTAHAEVAAIRNARGADLAGATLYSSCEPCPLCQAAAALVGISAIVYAAPKETAAAAGFELGPAAAAMQELLRSAGLVRLEHVETPGAAEPFERVPAAPRANPVYELRVALTLGDYERAVAFYRDTLGLPVRVTWDEPEGKGTHPRRRPGDARAPLRGSGGADRPRRGRPPGGGAGAAGRGGRRLREDCRGARCGGRGARRSGQGDAVGGLNARVRAPDGMQLTLFTVLGD